MKIFWLFLLLFFIFSAQAQEAKSTFAYSGFSGGMLLHSGYVQSENYTLKNADATATKTMKHSGLPSGIGGAARLHFGKHLRVGAEGYVSEYHYENQSYVSTGWGGVLADCALESGRLTYFVGGTFGGGSQKNLTVFEAPTDGYDGFVIDDKMSFRKFSFLCIAPFVGAEFALNKKIHLVLKADYLINISNPQPDFVTGVRVYLGFSFCR
ncbi:MAG: hypothetical protein LBN23_01480 [Paludibacter sp.]|jgi:hypothetical protein|nr:hypothetical protein [Paludibacter sp.]